MGGGFLNTRGLFVVVATIAALLLATGCGGGSSNSEVTVQTGSLSKAEFVKKADAICEAARTEFLAMYSAFLKAHSSEVNSAQSQEALFTEMVETILSPNIEGQIEQISELGAPTDYAPKATSFLNALQKRIDEASEDPAGLTTTAFPFKKAEDVAKGVGMNGCAESFS
jgi:hypothetical protein